MYKLEGFSKKEIGTEPRKRVRLSEFHHPDAALAINILTIVSADFQSVTVFAIKAWLLS